MVDTKRSLKATTPDLPNITGAKQGRTLLTGAYLGIVKDTNDAQRMGRIRVHIPDLGGHPSNSDHWITCSYVSPFAGATPPSQTQNSSEIKATQVSYGFWFPVPDVENEVIVMFLNGDPNKAIWIGCRFQQNMNQMVPGIAGSNTEEGFASGGEYNKTTENRPSAPSRTVHPLHAGLKAQGLENDQIRGVSTSSARRQGTSRAYGILTPRGTQIVIDDGVQLSSIPEQNESSPEYKADLNKNPAHQTVSKTDEPEPNRTSEYIRFRTRGGTQILLSETDGMIYMATRNGQTWVELSVDGNVDVFAGKSVSIHAQSDLNLVAQTDVNIEAGRNINLKARGGTTTDVAGGKGSIYMQADQNIHTSCGQSMYTKVGKEKHVTVAEDYRIQSKFINQATSDTYVLQVGKDQHIRVAQTRFDQVDADVKTAIAGKFSMEIADEASLDIASFFSLRAAGFSISGLDEGLGISSTSSGLQINSPQDIKIQGSNVHIKGTPHISSGGDNNPADSTPALPSFSAVTAPALPVAPTAATPPVVNSLSSNAHYGSSIATRAPEREPWQGHIVSSTSSHAPYNGPNESISQTKARVTAPPAGSAAYEGRPAQASKGASVAASSTVSTPIATAPNTPSSVATQENTAGEPGTPTTAASSVASAAKAVASAASTVSGVVANPALSGAKTAAKSVATAVSSVAGSTNPAASNVNFEKLSNDVVKFVKTKATGILSAITGLKVSEKGMNYICSWEQYVPFEYPDGELDGKQLYAIGYGHLLQGQDDEFITAQILGGLTEEEAFDLLVNTDIPKIEKQLRKKIKVSLRQHEYDALVDCAYNRGLGNQGLLQAIEALNNNNREGVADALLSSHATNGGEPNLILRRKADVELFYTGAYNVHLSREDLKGIGLKDYAYNQWIGDNLYRKWGRTVFPETEHGDKVIAQAYVAYSKSTGKDKYNLPDTLPVKDSQKPRLTRSITSSLAKTKEYQAKLIAQRDKLLGN
jgi:GH24 family phage-related lysozyme (muramidase)